MWGSTLAVDLQVYLKVGPVRLVVPVQVRGLDSTGLDWCWCWLDWCCG